MGLPPIVGQARSCQLVSVNPVIEAGVVTDLRDLLIGEPCCGCCSRSPASAGSSGRPGNCLSKILLLPGAPGCPAEDTSR